jgi:outer membrane receptor protein involved in Fe transport
VSIYTDEVPRNVPVMSDTLDLDIERLEVLKGPQGTLFGQSSTGGAINYILGKPTDTLDVGAFASYERFDRFELSGHISGPLTETLRARLAVKGVTGGAWQRSLSRPDDENGKERKLMGRFTLDFEPSTAVKFRFTATGASDKSDPLAPQYAGTLLNVYGTQAALAASGNPFGVVDAARFQSLTNPTSPGFDASFLGRQTTVVGRLSSANPQEQAGARALLGTAISNNSRDAEWTPGLLGKSDNDFYQFSLRGDFEVSDSVTITSNTAYAKKTLDYAQDLDGTTARVVDVPLDGRVETFNQELRLAGESGALNWIVGASFDDIRTVQNNFFFLGDYSANLGLITLTRNNFDSKQISYGVFGNFEYEVTDKLTVQGGIRYTKNELDATYCYNDPPQDTAQGTAFIFGAALNSVSIPIQPGQCFPTTGDLLLGTARSTLDPVEASLNEDNVSFRLGANYKFDGGALLYATLSQGYKAGIFSAIGASRVNQYTPATQEKVIAYEAGLKAPIVGNRVQLNAAAFYYDYSDKQVRGRVQDTVFGLLEKMLNVPESYIWGLEGALTAEPVDGLNLSASATYLQSKVTGDYSQTPDGLAVYNASGFTSNFRGSALPYTPEFSANFDAQYETSLSSNLKGFVGGTVVYTGTQNATFETSVLQADDFIIPSFTTLDVRAGVASDDGRWRVSAFGRNVTNESYITAVSTFLDTLVRYRGRPAVYGISFQFNY